MGDVRNGYRCSNRNLCYHPSRADCLQRQWSRKLLWATRFSDIPSSPTDKIIRWYLRLLVLDHRRVWDSKDYVSGSSFMMQEWALTIPNSMDYMIVRRSVTFGMCFTHTAPRCLFRRLSVSSSTRSFSFAWGETSLWTDGTCDLGSPGMRIGGAETLPEIQL